MLPNESCFTNGLLSYKVKSLVINEIVAVISGGWNLIIGRLARLNKNLWGLGRFGLCPDCQPSESGGETITLRI